MIQQLRELSFFKEDPRLTFQDSSWKVHEVEIEDVELSSVLQKVDLFPQFYFQTRENSEFAGLGLILDGLSVFDKMPAFYFYQKEFNWNPRIPKRSWDLPELALCPIQIQKKAGQTLLRWIENLASPMTLRWQKPKLSPFPLIQKQTLSPSFTEWMHLFSQLPALWGELKKVVLARKYQIDLNASLDPYAFLERMKNPKHYNFMICKNSETAFMGSSPERLFQLDHEQIQTEAVAGTRAKDRAQELLNSDKDLKEHRWVVDDIKANLSSFSSKISYETTPALVESKNLAHLKTFISAEATAPLDLDWMERLSPTAAICGYPRALALQTLQKFEPFQRGFYSAPVGIFEKNSADICVAIRSCYLTPNRLELFSGVGVIPESDAQQEWNELDLKIKPYLDLLK